VPRPIFLNCAIKKTNHLLHSAHRHLVMLMQAGTLTVEHGEALPHDLGREQPHVAE
jgi:hypothetical protein